MTNIYGDNDTNMCMAQLKLLTTKVQQITIITVQHTINDTRTMSSVPSMSGGVPHDIYHLYSFMLFLLHC